MPTQRFTIKLTQLRCIKESDPGVSEPYIWVTYFALGSQLPPFQTGPLALNTPSYDAFRTEFASMSAGDVVGIPTFIASAGFNMDLDIAGPKLLGCVAVLMEEDDTRQSDIVFGRIAYSKEMGKQLNALMKKRIQTNDMSDITDAEKETIRKAVSSKVSDAVGSHQGLFDIYRDQDDSLGFTHKILPDTAGGTIQPGRFDFPEITTIKKTPFGSVEILTVTDRYVLSGEVTVEAVGSNPVDPCLAQRAAVEAKRQEIKGLQLRITSLQKQLKTATPQQRAAIVQQITETNAEITAAEAQLTSLKAALTRCIEDPRIHDHGGLQDVVVVG